MLNIVAVSKKRQKRNAKFTWHSFFYPVAGRTYVETAYDEFGRESQLTYGNGNTTIYSYDERHQISSVTSTGDKNSQTTYKYDAKGNIIEKNGEHNNYKYLYDILGRIKNHQNKMFW